MDKTLFLKGVDAELRKDLQDTAMNATQCLQKAKSLAACMLIPTPDLGRFDTRTAAWARYTRPQQQQRDGKTSGGSLAAFQFLPDNIPELKQLFVNVNYGKDAISTAAKTYCRGTGRVQTSKDGRNVIQVKVLTAVRGSIASYAFRMFVVGVLMPPQQPATEAVHALRNLMPALTQEFKTLVSAMDVVETLCGTQPYQFIKTVLLHASLPDTETLTYLSSNKLNTDDNKRGFYNPSVSCWYNAGMRMLISHPALRHVLWQKDIAHHTPSSYESLLRDLSDALHPGPGVSSKKVANKVRKVVLKHTNVVETNKRLKKDGFKPGEMSDGGALVKDLLTTVTCEMQVDVLFLRLLHAGKTKQQALVLIQNIFRMFAFTKYRDGPDNKLYDRIKPAYTNVWSTAPKDAYNEFKSSTMEALCSVPSHERPMFLFCFCHRSSPDGIQYLPAAETSDSETSDSETPKPETLDSETSDSETSDSETSDSETSDSETREPQIREPTAIKTTEYAELNDEIVVAETTIDGIEYGSETYVLCSVALHIGSDLMSGHYMAYVRQTQNRGSMFLEYDDDRVSSTDILSAGTTEHNTVMCNWVAVMYARRLPVRPRT